MVSKEMSAIGKVKDSTVEVVGSNPQLTINLDQSLDKHYNSIHYWKYQPGTVECAIILQMGGWILKNDYLMKPNFGQN